MKFFTVTKKAKGSSARLGVMETAHGTIHSPVFMPVGTQATVKGLFPRDLKEIGSQIVLGNTYHLMLRPGLEIIGKAGGLHEFMGWDGPILTDSGGFQVYSLARLRTITEEGVEFQSHIDGSRQFLGPRESMHIQYVLGSDIVMVFDECTPYPCDHEYACRSLRNVLKWYGVCKNFAIEHRFRELKRFLFGIVQGSFFKDLRKQCVDELRALEFDGYAIGGVSVGEPSELLYDIVGFTADLLPFESPRYLMGCGTPADIVRCVDLGVDMFDCVMPTRNGRNGTAFTREGIVSVKAGRYKDDFNSLDEGCSCYCCRNFTRAYLRHLFNSGEMLGPQLVSLHNVFFYNRLAQEIRESIQNDSWDSKKREILSVY